MLVRGRKSNTMEMRIQKYLSQKGILSRRKAEEAISRGFISVNGEIVTELGIKIDPRIDKVTLHEEIVKTQRSYTYMAFNKPKGIFSNCAQDGGKEITDLLPEKYQHLNTIGRLDKDSEGLILLTDDGVFSNKYLNSDEVFDKRYLVWLAHPIKKEDCEALEKGVDIGACVTQPCSIKLISDRHLIIVITEGKNRQIRRLFQTVGNVVVGLKRVQFGPYQLGDIPLGKFEITKKQ
jgi:23S rRNA pseudouridine2605 synthase